MLMIEALRKLVKRMHHQLEVVLLGSVAIAAPFKT